jgi:hypothetical protein
MARLGDPHGCVPPLTGKAQGILREETVRRRGGVG